MATLFIHSLSSNFVTDWQMRLITPNDSHRLADSQQLGPYFRNFVCCHLTQNFECGSVGRHFVLQTELNGRDFKYESK